MQRKHLFILDPIDKLNIKLDSSLRLAFELHQLGDDIYYTEPPFISLYSGKVPEASVAALNFHDSVTRFDLGTFETANLSQFTTIQMRKDPPFDLAYLTTTWFLDHVVQTIPVMNHPQALRDFNEKLVISLFPKDSMPTLVSSNLKQLTDFALSCPNYDVVIKPLDLFGGKEIQRLNFQERNRPKSMATVEEVLQKNHQPIMMQPFNEGIFKGEVRVFTAFGKPISWCLKTPKAGQFLANTNAGASLTVYNPSDKDISRIRGVAEVLEKRGIYFAGFDLIDGLISEINVTSPRLLVAPGDKTNYYRIVAEMLINKI